MRILSIIKKDLKATLRNRIKVLCVIVAICMPLIYGFLYLWTSWDPYNSMDKIQVAIVNEDFGAAYKDKQINFGEDIIEVLKSFKVLDWDFVDYHTARKGLDDQKYYAIIRIPEDFSANLTSTSGDNPMQASIEWQTKDSTNYLFTTYFKAAIREMGIRLNTMIVSKFEEEVDEKAGNLLSSLDAASDGAATLANGINTLKDGSATLNENLDKAVSGSDVIKNGLSELDAKYGELHDGIIKTKEGSAVLNTGIGTATSGAQSLDEGLGKLESGANQLKDGTHEADLGSNKLATGTNQMYSELKAADDALSPIYPTISQTGDLIDEVNAHTPIDIPNYATAVIDTKNELMSGQKQINDGAQTLATGMITLDNGANTLATGVSSAKSGSSSLSSGLNQLNDGSKALNDGLSQLYNGSRKVSRGINQAYVGTALLNNGLTQLSSGNKQLTSGLTTAAEGADQLSTKLKDGYTNAQNTLTNEKIEKLLRIINEPVVFKDFSTDAVENYGTGLAPYFIPLALWMGALIGSLLVPIKETRLTLNNVPAWQIGIAKSVMPAIVSIMQVGALLFALLIGLNMKAYSLVPFILFCILIALCFGTIMQFLAFAFGKIGELMGIIVMMLQLTSSSGTFPVEASPRFFQIVYPLSPMTYAIKGLRILILGGSGEIVIIQTLVLLFITVLFLGLRILFTKPTLTGTDLYPLIEL